MKKFQLFKLIIIPFIYFQSVNAQMVYMPDSLLRTKLISLGFGSCITGDSISSTCPLVLNTTVLHVDSSSITSLEGIEVFTSLVDFSCNKNLITSLPLFPSTLTYLQCQNNRLMTLPSLPSSLRTLDCHYNLLTSLPVLPATLIALTCNGNDLTSLSSLPTSLTFLDCSGNQLDSLPALPPFLESLYCYSNQLISLPVLPPTLKILACYNNLLTAIPSLFTLTHLYCFNNQITSLPPLPNSLTWLNCFDNQLASLPALPSSLTYIDASNNLLTSLPALPSLLTTLNCGGNQLTSLPVLSASLINLNCGSNNLTALPALPSTLVSLECSNNDISSIPFLPATLSSLQCNNNLLTSLPALPGLLNSLSCRVNQISVLPSLPASLKSLICSNNLLTFLPDLPADSMTILFCQNNNLTSLPELPKYIYDFECYNNTSLSCLPELHDLHYFNFYNCNVACVPNYGNIFFSSPNVSLMPLCDLFDSSGCDFYWNINGKTFFDTDANCSQSSNEQSISNIHIKLFENGNLTQQAFTNSNGKFSFDVNNTGNYTVNADMTNTPFSVLCLAGNSYNDTITLTDSLFYDNDFPLTCRAGFDLGVSSVVTGQLRTGNLATVNISAGDMSNYFGANCANGLSGTLTILISGNAHYYDSIQGSIAPTSVSGNLITYNIADFGAINFNGDFSFEIRVDTFATPGSQICFNVNVSSISGDYNISNNSLSQCFTVRGSLDPNDKEVYPSGVIDTSQHWLTYTIRFQNTGNASAEHIYIIDTLDSELDVSTFELLSASHPAYVQVLNGGIIKFNFPGINLPDSFSNEELSNGYVQYKIRIEDNLSAGTQIRNTAHIYFDFNLPVATNTTLNTIDIISGIKNNISVESLKVWPVPFEDKFIIQSEFKNSIFSIIDIYGKEIINGKINEAMFEVSTSDWSTGIYFLRLWMNEEVINKQIIKQ